MNMPKLTQRQVELSSIALAALLATFFFGWMFGVEPEIRRSLEAKLGHSIFRLPDVVSFTYAFGVGVAFPATVCVGAWTLAYYRWFVPNRTRLANEQLKKLADARKAMTDAVAYLALIEQDLQQKSHEAERLQDQVLSLRLINEENVEDLQRKLKAMSVLNTQRIWYERGFAFFIGVASSIAATFLIEFFNQS
jgi:hypothetical protein